MCVKILQMTSRAEDILIENVFLTAQHQTDELPSNIECLFKLVILIKHENDPNTRTTMRIKESFWLCFYFLFLFFCLFKALAMEIAVSYNHTPSSNIWDGKY